MSVQVTAANLLRAAAKGVVNAQNMNSVIVAMSRYGAELAMDKPHRAVQFYAQIMYGTLQAFLTAVLEPDRAADLLRRDENF